MADAEPQDSAAATTTEEEREAPVLLNEPAPTEPTPAEAPKSPPPAEKKEAPAPATPDKSPKQEQVPMAADISFGLSVQELRNLFEERETVDGLKALGKQ
jgi:hypothetical protein